MSTCAHAHRDPHCTRCHTRPQHTRPLSLRVCGTAALGPACDAAPWLHTSPQGGRERAQNFPVCFSATSCGSIIISTSSFLKTALGTSALAHNAVFFSKSTWGSKGRGTRAVLGPCLPLRALDLAHGQHRSPRVTAAPGAPACPSQWANRAATQRSPFASQEDGEKQPEPYGPALGPLSAGLRATPAPGEGPQEHRGRSTGTTHGRTGAADQKIGTGQFQETWGPQDLRGSPAAPSAAGGVTW